MNTANRISAGLIVPKTGLLSNWKHSYLWFPPALLPTEKTPRGDNAGEKTGSRITKRQIMADDQSTGRCISACTLTVFNSYIFITSESLWEFERT